MYYNYVIDNLRQWCRLQSQQYRKGYEEKGGLYYVTYQTIEDIQFRLEVLTDRDFTDYADLSQEVRKLPDTYCTAALQNPPNQLAAHLIRRTANRFLAYFDTLTPECPALSLPYRRTILGEEAECIYRRFADVWNYRVSYWYPLDGTDSEGRLFLMTEHVEPHMEEIKDFLGLPHTHMYAIGETNYPAQKSAFETAELIPYSGLETAYTNKEFTWMIYFSHENTVTFAGSIVLGIQELLADEKEHWNHWE